MAIPRDQVCDMLLALMSPVRCPDARVLEGLDASDWENIKAVGHQHRVLPLVHHRLRGAGRDWPVPEPFRTACAAAFRSRSLRAIRAQRALARCLALLTGAGIEVTALKGAWLAFHAYPQPGLRPLRDLDLLVHRDQAQAGFHLLVSDGFVPVLGKTGDLDAYMQIKHQLPPLRCPQSGICVELHHRCLHGAEGAPDLPDDPQFRPRQIGGEVGGAPVLYMGREHLLLHLVIHSARDHVFDNGPGILPDVAMVLASGPFDWLCFWSAAERFDADAAAVLVLTMAERLWGVTGIDWQGRDGRSAELSAEVVAAAMQLTMRDLTSSKQLAVLGALDARRSVLAKARYVVGKVFPPAAVLRAVYPSIGQAREVPLLYLRRWRDMIARNTGNTSAVADADRARMAQVSAWLARR